jgi:hypothetical protein
VFRLFVPVVLKHSPEFHIGAGLDSLIVPIDRFQFLHQCRDCPVPVEDIGPQAIAVLVQ